MQIFSDRHLANFYFFSKKNNVQHKIKYFCMLFVVRVSNIHAGYDQPPRGK